MQEPTAAEALYQQVVDGWNGLDAGRIASAFTSGGLMIGYDGTEMRGGTGIAESLGEIFRDHSPGRWVALVQGIDPVMEGVQVLRAHAGWFMSSTPDSFPAAVQTVVAVRNGGEWRIALLQTTPAAWHGRAADISELEQGLRTAASPETAESRSTRIAWHVNAPRSRVYRALLDPMSVARWMVPDGMSSRVHAFEAEEGGFFRISLTYEAPTGTGKTSAQTDTYHGRFVKLVEDEEVVEVVEFETSDPALQGQMTISITLAERDGGTEVVAVHDGLPPGLSSVANETGWRSSLSKLQELVEAG